VSNTPPAARGRRLALLISTSVYDDAAFGALRAPAADVASLRSVLEDRTIGAYEVTAVSDSQKHVVEQVVDDFFADAGSDDHLLLYITGHGVKDDAGRLYFVMQNSRLDRLASRAMSADFVRECMDASRSRKKVVVLDCCFSGAFPPGSARRAGGDVDALSHLMTDGRGSVVITASSALEYAFESSGHASQLKDTTPSVFTEALVTGIATGEADRDGDGLIDIDELYHYAFDEIRKQTRSQTPQLKKDVQGRIYIAAVPGAVPLDNEPPWWTPDIERILFTKAVISSKVAALARRIDAEYRDLDRVFLVANLDGSERFANELAGALRMPAQIGYINAEFIDKTVRIHQSPQQYLGAHHVLLVQTLADGSRTDWLVRYLASMDPLSLNVCALLHKPGGAVEVRFAGFEAPDEVIVGYGLSYYDLYAFLPYIAILSPLVYSRG
jgi:hypoxanthine phosphoribosyltransferase